MNKGHRVLHNPSMWRGSLLPLGREAALKWAGLVYLKECSRLIWGCFAAQRQQAPSPQKSSPPTNQAPDFPGIIQSSPLAFARS